MKILRDFRDRFLLNNSVGMALVRLYYTYSPPIADFIKTHVYLKAVVRAGLLPVVGISWIALKVGFVPAMALMFFFISCFIGFMSYRKLKNE